MTDVRPVDDADRNDAAAPAGGPEAAADHLRQPHQQLLELALRARRPRQDMRVAVALAGGTLEGAYLEAAQAPKPGLGDRSLHARETELVRARAQEFDWRMYAGAQKAGGRGLGDSGEVGQPQALEHRHQVRVVDPLQPVALVEVGRLLGHPARSGEADRARDAFAHLAKQRTLDRAANSLRSELDCR